MFDSISGSNDGGWPFGVFALRVHSSRWPLGMTPEVCGVIPTGCRVDMSWHVVVVQGGCVKGAGNRPDAVTGGG